MLKFRRSSSHSPTTWSCSTKVGHSSCGIWDHIRKWKIANSWHSVQGGQSKPAEMALRETFESNGLPSAILSDNGCPLGSRGLFFWSIQNLVIFNAPRDRCASNRTRTPEQNGRHERMHLTLKRATTRLAGANLLQQQERFDKFKREFIEWRPYEALAMKTASEIWKSPTRKMPQELPEPDYKIEELVRYVSNFGIVNLRRGKGFHLSSAFDDELTKKISPTCI